MLDTRMRAADHEAKRRAQSALYDEDFVAANRQDSVKNAGVALENFLTHARFDPADPAALGVVLTQMIAGQPGLLLIALRLGARGQG